MDFTKMNTDELIFRQNEIRTLVDTEGADLTALEEEARGIKAELESREAAESKRQEIRDMLAKNKIAVLDVRKIEAQEDNKSLNVDEIRNSKAYINAYAEYIKTGDDSECRALLTTNATNGTVAVPTFVYDTVKTAWDRDGLIRRVRKAYLKGNLKVGFEISGTDAVVHTEGSGEVTEEGLVLGTVELVPASIKKWISFSDEVMDMKGEAFLTYIYDELAYRIAKKAADQLIAAIEECGTTSTETTPAVASVQKATLGMDVVATAIGELSAEASNPVVIMNKATWAKFKAIQYANGYAADPFEGLEVEFNSTIKSYDAASTGDTYLIVGDLDEGALMNLPNGEGVEFKFDNTTLMTSDMIRVLGRTFAAIKVVAPNAFCKVTK